ncbi:MAG: DNA topoisomerase VI subunit B [Planctomycetota bacterium]|nr:DNA topoisomerase VI subunit B [Planctomycetota bacterium]MDA0935269.1 DNA topoisomerase VI subunit B [Planctomycetota bacterium]
MKDESIQPGLFDDDGTSADKPSSPTRKKAGGGGGATAEQMAKRQREISVSEFFTKNRHLLGFDSPRKALLTAVKEAVDNSLDACEEARILPEVLVEISKVEGHENHFTVAIEDNGPGIVKAQVPNIFGKLLYGSKFHRLRQSRGQQGIGISAAGMYGQLTTGQPIRVWSRTSRRAKAHRFTIRIDTSKNNPVATDEEVEWDKAQGTRVEIDLEGEFRRGQRSVGEFLKLVAVANPHAKISFRDPENEAVVYEAATKELPKETDEIKPHPHGVELGILQKMLQETSEKWVHLFLQKDFSRVGPKVAKEICDKAKISDRAHPKRIAREQALALKKAIDATKIMAPPTSCIAPIGEDGILAGLKKEVEADFYTATTRAPVVYRGHPFQIEVGIAYGRPGDTLDVSESGKIFEDAEKKKRRKKLAEEDLLAEADQPARLIRYANRVPLLFQQSACAVTKAVIQTNWRGYGMQQPRGGLPVGPMVVFVHMASVWVPFTSESKEAIAHYDEIIKELKLALQECGRKLGTHIRKGKKLSGEFKKRNYISTYIPHIGEALQEILGLTDGKRDECVENLTEVLERSRKI